MTAEHVDVNSGGQDVAGVVEPPGAGITPSWKITPMQSKLPMHLSRRCGARTRAGAMPITSDAERADAAFMVDDRRGRRRVTGTPSGVAATPPRGLPATARSQRRFAQCAPACSTQEAAG
jgi:hypothetical protein